MAAILTSTSANKKVFHHCALIELRSPQVNLLIVTFPKTVHDCAENSTI